MNIDYNAIICRYGELALKKGNRAQFEDCLIGNMSRLLKKIEDIKILKVRGRIYIQKRDYSPFNNEELNIFYSRLPKAFGLYSFSPAIMMEAEMEKIKLKLAEIRNEIFDKLIETRGDEPLTFCIRARRSNKEFPLQSKGIELELAEVVGKYEKRDQLKVSLKNPEVTISCEVRHEFSFLYFESFSGPGGLPVNAKNPVLSLLSGGIDSPVACYLGMKRGCQVHYLTFHSAPYTPEETVDKVKKLAEMLNDFQKPGKLYAVNLAEFQRLVRDNCRESLRTILYRRAMMRIAEIIARKIKAKALLTGEAIGQVASQTLENMNTIQDATKMVIIRPVVTMDKEDIIKIAQDIDTFETSSIQCIDSCTVFAPRSAATTSRIDRLEEEEAKIPNYNELLEKIAKEAVKYTC